MKDSQMNEAQYGRWTRKGPLLLAGVGMLSLGLLLSERTDAQNGERVEIAREVLGKWLETRQLISKERQDAVLAKELLHARVDLVRAEAEELKEQIRTTQAEIFSADTRREGLEEKKEELQLGSEAVKERLVSMEERTLNLLPRLPDALRKSVQSLSQRIPRNPDQSRLSVSERYQYMIGVLNEVNKFNATITLTSEVRTLKGGTAAEVATLYLGLGQAYYASPDGLAAGIGTLGQEGWEWIEMPDQADAILKAIAVLKNELPARYVQLPVELR